MEILGIALVVVVLVFAGLIFLSFGLNKPHTEGLKHFLQINIIKEYYIPTMLETTVNCSGSNNGLQVKNVLNRYLDGEGNAYSCLVDSIPKLLYFLNESGICYDFSIEGLLVINGNCSSANSVTTEQPFMSDSGASATITLTLYS